MLPREAATIDEPSSTPNGFEFDDLDEEETEEVFEDGGNERGTWHKVCAAKRSIERMREQRDLQALLSDVFDENDDSTDYLDGSDDE